MDTFRDRLYGLSSASDEMPSAVVMKVSSVSIRSELLELTLLVRTAFQLENG